MNKRLVRIALAVLIIAAAGGTRTYSCDPEKVARTNPHESSVRKKDPWGANSVAVSVDDAMVRIAPFPLPDEHPDEYLLSIKREHLEGICSVIPVREFTFARVSIADDAYSMLATVSTLKRISMASVNFSDEQARRLAESETIESISIVGTEITDDGLLELARIEGLKHVYLFSNGTTAGAAARLKKLLPDCEVIDDDARLKSKRHPNGRDGAVE